METFHNLIMGFEHSLSGYNLLFVVVGACVGTWVGMLPGIGPATAIAVLLPFSFGLDPTSALILLSGIYFGAMYGGAISSILLNIPGDASAIMTTMEGHPLAKQGRAGAALLMSAAASFIGGTIGLLALTFLAKPISVFAISLGPAEYFTLMVFALVATATLVEGSAVKGFLSTALGLILATIGIDLQSGVARFTFGLPDLLDGIHLLTAIIGVYAITEILITVEHLAAGRWQAPAAIGKLWATKAEWMRARFAFLRGTAIGFVVGLLPGAGGAVATLLAYATEKRISRHPEQFGKGAIEGLAAPEAANNASVSGALVPLLTLGIPGSSATAVLLGALMMFGIQPGPRLFVEQPVLTWSVIASLYIGNVVLVILNIPLIGLWVRLLKIPIQLMMALIGVLAVTGAYSIANSMFDVWIALGFGVIGYLMRKRNIPTTPMILGLVLSRTLEQSLRQSLTLFAGDWTAFFTRPLSLIFIILSVLCVVAPMMIRQLKQLKPQTLLAEKEKAAVVTERVHVKK